MQENDFGSSFLNDFQPFQFIESIRFTHREIDIIACLLQGRTQKTIANFLSIAPRTVETHLRNIMLKLECNSRESIIDYVENAGQSSAFRSRYQALLIQAEFEKQLQAIAQHIKGESYACRFLSEKSQGDEIALIQKLDEHLKKVGIKTSREKVEKSKSIIDFYLNKTTLEKQPILYVTSKDTLVSFIDSSEENLNIKELDELIVLLWEQESLLEVLPKIKGVKYINLYENYYLSFFEILKNIFFNISLDNFVSSFKKKYELLQADSSQLDSKVKRNDLEGLSLSLENKTILSDLKPYILSVNIKRFITSALIIIVLAFGIISFKEVQGDRTRQHVNSQRTAPITQTIHSDLVVPKESVFLQRPLLIAEIDKALKDQKDIRTVALVGVGGAGKTTLARQYARAQKSSVMWEINAETKESLRNSFESLAYALVKTEDEKKILRELQETKDAKAREEKFLQFVMGRLKSHSGWLLIYDNVEKFADIQKYFPYDSDAWGQGKILITTRDNNIINNNHIHNSLLLGELSPKERLVLFTQIMNNRNKNKFTVAQEKQTEKFLENIPPFPLDVSVAAYYLKTTNIPYSKYVEYLKEYNKDFENLGKDVLKEASDYTKTRHGIITVSLNQLIETHKDFVELLLFICLLNSHEIPRDLLEIYKSNIIVDSFIYNLKKYSFITEDSNIYFKKSSTFTIHKSTQAICLNQLIKILKLKTDKKKIFPIIQSLEKYIAKIIEKEALSKIKILTIHCESLLSHNELLKEDMVYTIKSNLGGLYTHTQYYKKARALLEEGTSSLYKQEKKNYALIGQSLVYLGFVYRELNDYQAAKNTLQESLKIFHSHSKNDFVIVRALIYLGVVYRNLGNFEKAKILLEQSLNTYTRYVANHDIDATQASIYLTNIYTYLGTVYINLGDLKNAKSFLEKSLNIYKNQPLENPLGISRALAYLGIAHRELGDYKRALDLFNQGITLYNKHFNENNNDVAWALAHVGDIYSEYGDYNKAKLNLEKSMDIFKKNLSENSIGGAQCSGYLGKLYLELADYQKARTLLKRSLNLYKKHFSDNHVGVLWAKMYLGNIDKEEGNYSKARTLFENLLPIYEKTYGQEHIETAYLLISLGEVYALEQQFDISEITVNKGLKILEKLKHPKISKALEILADLYMKKSLQNINIENTKYAQRYKQQAINYLNQALEIAKSHYFKGSPFISRINLHLKNLT
ncbi:MAG: hypothetical protein BGO76_06335 [Caedibacter sp. 38-128]|nr:MAG: hypothetical protein BGO76_06335 [Caedibacter sp. 38-128]